MSGSAVISLAEVARTIADVLILPAVWSLFSLHGRISRIEGSLDQLSKMLYNRFDEGKHR